MYPEIAQNFANGFKEFIIPGGTIGVNTLDVDATAVVVAGQHHRLVEPRRHLLRDVWLGLVGSVGGRGHCAI